MAQDARGLVDTQHEKPGDLKALEASLREGAGTPSKTADADTGEDRIPKKLRGKSYEEVIDMYQNLESAFGRMANDLGTQRKFTDQLLELKRAGDLKSGGAEEVKVEKRKIDIKASELLERPGEVLERELEHRDREIERKVEERLAKLTVASKEQQFAQKHPDAKETVESEEFASWIQQSPVRARAAALVRQTGDYELADDLLTEYKSANKRETREERNEDDASAARRASFEGSGSSKRSTSGKRYRRADLIQLKVTNPTLYDSMSDEITRAYAEKRVD